MLKFDSIKPKSLSVPIMITGTESSKLSFTFVVEVNNIKYGFNALNQGNNLKIIIPPLSEVISDIKTGTYNAYIEANMITEDSKGFYMKPWNKQIEVINIPKVTIELQEDTKEDINISVPLVEEVKIDKVEKIIKKDEIIEKENHNSRFSNIFK